MRKQLVLVTLLVMVAISAMAAPTFAETKKVELHFLGWFSAEMHKKYVDFANAYMQKHFPNVTVTGASTDGTGENYNSKVMVSIASGAGPDS